MNLEFRKTGIGRAENGDGAVVEGMGRELMRYERLDFHLPIETFFVDGRAVAYQPSLLPAPLPAGMSAEDVYAEVRAGIAAATRREVEWKVR